jgi:cytochrome c553
MKNPVRSMIALVTLATTLGLSLNAAAQDAKAGDAKAGEKQAAMCIGCHGIPGYQASFPDVYKVPMIAGQNAEYIVAALTEYKKGERKHPTMRGIAESLSSQDMADLAAFYATESKAAPPPATTAGTVPADVAALLAKGSCASCHGANFTTPIAPGYPKLAGQHASYLFAALKAYQVDNNPILGRSNAIMKGMAGPFSHAELKVLADYFSSLPGVLETVPQSRFR